MNIEQKTILTTGANRGIGRALVTVHGVFLGPVDTDMTRGFEIPKISPEAAARGIFDGFENGEEDFFPDPASRRLTEGWRNGVVKALERQNAALLAGASR